MDLSTTGIDLIKELKRSDWLPPYNEDLMRKLKDEMVVLSNTIESTLATEIGGNEEDQNTQEESSMLVFYDSCLLHDKRCLLSYVNYRLDKISQLRWETGGTIPEEYQSLLSNTEIAYFKEYSNNLSNYFRSVEFDLTGNMNPPRSMYVEVLVKKDCGEIMTERGTVVLEKNTTHYLRYADVEHLIQLGYLELRDGR